MTNIITLWFPLAVALLYTITAGAFCWEQKYFSGALWFCYAVATVILVLQQNFDFK